MKLLEARQAHGRKPGNHTTVTERQFNKGFAGEETKRQNLSINAIKMKFLDIARNGGNNPCLDFILTSAAAEIVV